MISNNNEHEWLAERFEAERPHLRAVAYRMLGNQVEAEDAVQESWLHLSRSDTSEVKNMGGWLTTVVARVCLDMLRSRKSRHEEPLETFAPEPNISSENEIDPEEEVLLADSVGLALMVVLDTLSPAERLAFVLHDLFGVSFDEIAPIVGRTATTARQLASRARRRVQGAAQAKDADLTRQREVVEAFLAASRSGDFGALLAVLDPDVVFRYDAATPAGVAGEFLGATAVAKQFVGRAKGAQPALVNGNVAAVVVNRSGQLFLVLNFTVTNGKIAEIDVVGDPARLQQFDLTLLDN